MPDTTTGRADRERCGFLIEYSASIYTNRPGVYLISKGGESNIIGGRLFESFDATSDELFEEFATTALRPDFPHPFAIDED